jgi:hypothetical protein
MKKDPSPECNPVAGTFEPSLQSSSAARRWAPSR